MNVADLFNDADYKNFVVSELEDKGIFEVDNIGPGDYYPGCEIRDTDKWKIEHADEYYTMRITADSNETVVGEIIDHQASVYSRVYLLSDIDRHSIAIEIVEKLIKYSREQ